MKLPEPALVHKGIFLVLSAVVAIPCALLRLVKTCQDAVSFAWRAISTSLDLLHP